MKIAVFVSYLPPHMGGIESVADNQIKALAAAGQKVYVVTSACGATPGLTKYKNYQIQRIAAWNYFERRMGAVFPFFAPSLLWHSYRAVKQADVTHIHDAFYLTSLVATLWTRILRKPLILTQHVDMVPHPSKAVTLIQKFVYATTGKFIFNSSSRIIVLNSRVMAFLTNRSISKEKITFLPNSIDTEQFSPATTLQKEALRKKYNVPKDKTLALFVGRFVPKKGFTTLMELKPIDNLAVVFAGGNAPPGHNRKDHLFLGAIGRDDIADLFKMCNIFILPSEGEGFPVTIQEAMASGMPIITTDDPAYELYNFNRSKIELIAPINKDISTALEKISGDVLHQNKMAKYSRTYAIKNFAWTINARSLLGIYKGLVK